MPNSEGNLSRLDELRTTYFASADDTIGAGTTCGVVHVVLEEATLSTPGEYVATLSIGLQSYLSSTTDNTDNPKWSEGQHFVVQKKVPSSVHVSIYVPRKLKSRQLVGTCSVDLMAFFDSSVGDDSEGSWYDLKDPSNPQQIIGRAKLAVVASTVEKLEQQVWETLMYLVNLNGDAILRLDEFIKSIKDGVKTSHKGPWTWLSKLSEWVTFQGLEPEKGLNVAPILVVNRKTRQLEEETLATRRLLGMYTMYQTNFGASMLKEAVPILQFVTDQQAKYMISPESRSKIPKYVASFAGTVDVNENADPMDSFKNFNDFFIRKLKPSARPIADKDDDTVLVSAADSRFMAFQSVDDATKFWIKGSQFSISKLLADERLGTDLSKTYDQGSMALFRLAPQDYHRFHFPVSGTLVSITDVPGVLFAVHPVPVTSPFANVLIENKRTVCVIESPVFGKVAYVAIGAAIIGSINITAKVGETYKKGDEVGFFAYGGSTTVALFEKGKMVFDDDLVETSKGSMETVVRMGERIGVAAD